MTAKVKGGDSNMYEQVFNVNLGTIDANDERVNVAAFEGLTIVAQSAMLPNFTLDTTDLASAGWTKSGGGIPEPTSGLLLVLGGAMLALRRRLA